MTKEQDRPAPAASAGAGVELLIVEDSPTQALKLEQLLRTAGYAVASAGDGEAALAYLKEHKPALIVSDIVMPRMDGYEMCRRIKADERLRGLPVLLLTSLSDFNDVLLGLEAGADSFATKPYDGPRLLSRINNILSNRELWKKTPQGDKVSILFAGQEHRIAVGAQTTLEFLLYTYEDAVEKNLDLIKVRDQLALSNVELKRKAAELAMINKELESFSYSVSHDLRAPLNRIDGFSQALMEEYQEKLDDVGRDYLARLRSSCRRMAHLIEDMLMLSRVTRADMVRANVELSMLAQSIAGELQRDHPQRQVELVITPGIRAEGDERLLKIALTNLLGNAWKFTGKKAQARIEFGAAAQDGRPVFFVRDNGAGFDMQHAEKLFGTFQRLHTNEDFPGTGVGLATVQRIIHRHGGQIWAEGRVGEGAVFYFTLG